MSEDENPLEPPQSRTNFKRQGVKQQINRAAVLPSDQPAGELSYWLLPEARGQGLAVTAVTKMMHVAANAGVKSLVLDIEEANGPSIRVAERLGAARRTPTRLHTDRYGKRWPMVVYVLHVP
ncbi:MAG: GNAT family protein [Solirubrobacteraceae bacterium]